MHHILPFDPEKYRGGLYWLFNKWREPAEELDDLVQETLVRAWASFGTFKGGPIWPWLIRIAKRRAIDFSQRRIRWKRSDSTAPVTSASTSLDTTVLGRIAWAKVMELPVQERCVVRLCCAEGWGASEVGRRMGISPQMVCVIRNRALNRLRRLLCCHQEGETKP